MGNIKIVALVGSLRKKSVNRATAEAAIAQTPKNATMAIHEIDDLPFFNEDLEPDNIPKSVISLRKAIDEASGWILFSPEYNGSFPALTKNAIDWLSRPPQVWADKHMSMVSTTAGERAGTSILGHFKTIMSYQTVKLVDPLGIGKFSEKIDKDGAMSCSITLKRLADFMKKFCDECAE